uniref:Mitochondrial carrier protein MTM1 n=1 Tax=Salix viminalis TaxID=40686 RepID=A0A6N2MXK0_SALVM
MMGAKITQNQWEINSDSSSSSNGHDLMALDGNHDHGGFPERRFCDAQVQQQSNSAVTTTTTDGSLGVGERAVSAAGAAFLSAIIVNPLDVVKTRLQTQAAGVAYSHPLSNIISRMAYFGPTMMFADLRCSPSCTHAGVHGTVSICPPDCFQYKGTLDVFYKIIRQEGIARLWRGTNAGLALAVPTVGIYLPCYDLFRNWLEDLTAQNVPGATSYVPLVAGSMARSLACATCYPIELARTRMQFLATVRGYRFLWSGMGAQLARDVPYSAICWSTLEPKWQIQFSVDIDQEKASKFGWRGPQCFKSLWETFSAAFVAGSLAAAATCPLDVAKTRRQIEKDPIRALRMTTRQTLMEVWRDGGVRALFTGVGPRVGRAGPSVGIVVSFYEVAKHVLHHRYATSE